jgi:myo-inositol-1(or 4)-monophosphatase
MNDLDNLLDIAKQSARNALNILAGMTGKTSEYKFLEDLPREVKTSADKMLEQEIFRTLIPTGLPILSEEAGNVSGTMNSSLHWIVDPLDGTINYVRGVAPCAVSIALFRGLDPVFGVVGEFPSLKLAWGGPNIGTFLEDHPVHVSSIMEKSKAILCTGFPARFDFDGPEALFFMKRASLFAKVRMLGSAALSLVRVANGSADAYTEQDVMLWDVAAGLALVEGAGGKVTITTGHHQHSYKVSASNGHLQFD